MNKVFLIGRLGRDPEVRFIGTGKAVCTLSLATDEHWTDASGAKQKRVDWHRVQVWGKQAEACGKYLATGREVLVEGSIRTREYEKDGTKRYVTEVVAQRVQFLGGDGQRRDDRPDSADAAPVPEDGDIPF
jgi:single-strand DNA-binding protein